MGRLIKDGNGYLEVDDETGTFKRHDVQVSQVNGKVLKTELIGGVEVDTIIQPKILLTVDDAGNILQRQRGFVLDHEILGTPTHHEAGKHYVHVEAYKFPADYETVTTDGKKTINYSKFDRKTWKFGK